MPFTAMEVVCGYAGSPIWKQSSQPLLGRVTGSQSMAAGGTTTIAAPTATAQTGDPVFQVRALADSYIAVGPTPNATTGPRVPVPAGQTVTIYADPGDKLSWIAA